MAKDNYTFGDNPQAGARLRRLAELYEPETRQLLQASGVRAPHLAVDLGCGPGWSTRLLQEVLNPGRTVGLDASERYIAEARRLHSSDLQFEVHDVVTAPFPVPPPNVMFCRFLLTHLRSVERVLTTWASTAAPKALLIVHETESLETDHPGLRRYYDLVARLQQHYGQRLQVGAVLAWLIHENWLRGNLRCVFPEGSGLWRLPVGNCGCGDAVPGRVIVFEARLGHRQRAWQDSGGPAAGQLVLRASASSPNRDCHGQPLAR
jgi:SAM-dependent methyltransferase